MNHHQTVFRGTCLFVVLAFANPLLADDGKLQQLLDQSPSGANAIGYVHVKSLSRLMVERGVDESVASHVIDYWFVSDVDLTTVRPRWEAGLATLSRPVTAESLADTVGGYADRVRGETAVWSPKQAYLIPSGSKQLKILRPANRSLLSGWLAARANLYQSSFLKAHAKQPESFLSFMLAIDLEDAFSPVPLAERLSEYQSLQSQPPETVAGILASVKGVSVIIGRKSLQECILTVEFSRSPQSLEPIANKLLAELMSRSGTAAPEVLSWKVDAQKDQLSFKGPITESTLSGLLTIFSLQGQAARVAHSIDLRSGDRSKEQQVAYSSKHYFDEVNEIVERTRQHRSQTTGALARWNDQRARQIDELGTLNVDPEMVLYGTNVASLLRGNALQVVQGNIAAGKQKASQSLSDGYYGRSYYDANSTVDYQRVTSAHARGNAYVNYREALNQIDQLTASMRRSMTDKYKVQF
ncbi:MAG: hypothetical protein MI861_09105 [Pirellulales bacterium]|nr:hypothetical protein [Pirellulales bacterium]